MADISDLMLDGTLCACCGVELDSGNGYQTYCAGCLPDFSEAAPVDGWRCDNCGKRFGDLNALHMHVSAKHGGQGVSKKTRVPCQVCGRRVKNVGLDQHISDMHQGEEP